ncbi:isochorismatase family protein [Chloroflexota bacterium]
MKRWEEVFTGTDQELLQRSGMGRRQEYGKNPALLIIDVTRHFLGPNKPTLEAALESRVACGEVGWEAVDNIKKLLEACRNNNMPVIYAIPDTYTRAKSGMLQKGRKPEVAAKEDFREDAIADTIAPLDSELVIHKIRPSMFLGTPLVTCLRHMQVDSLLITGGVTSGCVRATTVDGFSYGFKCFVVEECTFDRFQLSHLVNLFDMNAKYADVITVEEALNHVREVGQLKNKHSV